MCSQIDFSRFLRSPARQGRRRVRGLQRVLPLQPAAGQREEAYPAGAASAHEDGVDVRTGDVERCQAAKGTAKTHTPTSSLNINSKCLGLLP